MPRLLLLVALAGLVLAGDAAARDRKPGQAACGLANAAGPAPDDELCGLTTLV